MGVFGKNIKISKKEKNWNVGEKDRWWRATGEVRAPHHDSDQDRQVRRPCWMFGRLGLRSLATPVYISITPDLLNSIRHNPAQQRGGNTCLFYR